jgi:prepilin-type N-terminal cleavage/methylation domain-containing protein
MHKKGFTLAEVLITLGIIGIVAALTIPNLLTNYKAKTYRTKLLEGYSILTQAAKRMEADNVAIDNDSYQHDFYKTFKNYLTGVTDCGYAGSSCPTKIIDNIYRSEKNLEVFITYTDDGVLLLQNGMVLLFNNYRTQPIIITIDINGNDNKPNLWGYDAFMFFYVDGKIIPSGAPDTEYSDSKYCGNNKSYLLNKVGCTNNAIQDPNYFKNLFK